MHNGGYTSLIIYIKYINTSELRFVFIYYLFISAIIYNHHLSYESYIYEVI